MGCCNEPSVTLTPSGQNPALHVNYAKGMVLGVDDFTQEFTYHANRDQWAVRELLGYGTTSGLAISLENGGADEGPRVMVKRGAAATPSGQLVCVPVDQCAFINKWLTKPDNAAKIAPSSTHISLYLTLCYRDCTTLPVPIPGDPCRSEDQLMADSRISDDYSLGFRTEAPPQTEDEAVRDFVFWLKQVPVDDGASPPVTDESLWLAGLKTAAQPWFDTLNGSPPLSPPANFAKLGDYLFDSPPTTLSVARTHLDDFLRVAFRFWVTDLRPFWMTQICGDAHAPESDCLFLARLDTPIVQIDGKWQVNGDKDAITVDESRRPYLAHTRLLQEWLLCGWVDEPPIPPVALPQNLAPSSSPVFAGLTTTGALHIAITTATTDLTLDASHHCVICSSGLALTLPKCSIGNQGRVYIIKSPAADSKIASDPADSIDTAGITDKAIAAGQAITLISDGANRWHTISALT